MHTHLTRISMRAAGAGLPARVDLRSGLLAARLVTRDETSAQVALLANGAMLLAGDRVRVDISVAPGCRLQLVDVGGTVAYDGEGRPCALDIVIDLGDAAALTWDALPMVISSGAMVGRTTHATLGADAELRMRETVVLGRAGEAGGRVRIDTRIEDARGPILVERIDLDGEHPVPGVAAGARVMDTMLVIGPEHGLASAAVPAPSAGRRPLTVLRLERAGTVLRWLGRQAHESPLARVAPTLPSPTRGHLRQLEAIS